MFKAIVLRRDDAGKTLAAIESLEESELPQIGERAVEVQVQYSTLNFKDGLAITGKSPVVRKFPMVPGIDFAGVVGSSEDPRWKAGDKVVLNGWGVGEGHWGGLAQKARVDGDWLIALPSVFSSQDAMAIGTAGYTAMLCVMALQRHGIAPGSGEILVTGASGGVGSVAIALLASAGYEVVASSGKADQADYLKSLGAKEVMDRQLLSAPGKPLQKERWAGVVDTVGSHTLTNACAQTRYGGAVAACGLAQGMDFPATVAPFILRGVSLVGIDSVMAPRAVREKAWQQLAQSLQSQSLQAISRVLALQDAIQLAPDILAGNIRGRIVVDVNR